MGWPRCVCVYVCLFVCSTVVFGLKPEEMKKQGTRLFEMLLCLNSLWSVSYKPTNQPVINNGLNPFIRIIMFPETLLVQWEWTTVLLAEWWLHWWKCYILNRELLMAIIFLLFFFSFVLFFSCSPPVSPQWIVCSSLPSTLWLLSCDTNLFHVLLLYGRESSLEGVFLSAYFLTVAV